jgi:hypothetical protein
MKLIKDTLDKRKQEIEIELRELIKLHNTNYLSMGFKALARSNKALKRHIDSKGQDSTAMKWAEKWNELKKKCVTMENKKDYITYSDIRVNLEIELSDINSELYYRYKRR